MAHFWVLCLRRPYMYWYIHKCLHKCIADYEAPSGPPTDGVALHFFMPGTFPKPCTRLLVVIYLRSCFRHGSSFDLCSKRKCFYNTRELKVGEWIYFERLSFCLQLINNVSRHIFPSLFYEYKHNFLLWNSSIEMYTVLFLVYQCKNAYKLLKILLFVNFKYDEPRCKFFVDMDH